MIKQNLNLMNGLLNSRRIQGGASLCTAFTSSRGMFSSVDVRSHPSSTFYQLNHFPSNPTTFDSSAAELNTNGIVFRFREWFLTRKNPVFDRLFDVLHNHEGSSADTALSGLNLFLTEALVLDVLNYRKDDVLSCLKFFDWVGRQPGFHLTRPTFNAIFRILLKAKLTSVLVDFLQNYMKHRYFHKVGYCNVLVIGYALAGRPDIALQLFGEMRFKGVDLDAFAYHILLHSLVEVGYVDAVEMLANQIRARGLQNEVTHSIVMKSFCKQNELEKGEEYLRHLVVQNRMQLNGVAVGIFVDALCKNNQIERATLFIEEFRGLVLMEHAYGIWIRNLVRVGKLDGALEFLKDKQTVEGYVPDVFRYNLLILRLLKENRLEDVYDLLEEMKENEIMPDNVTMNAMLCFLCKAGRMDIAMGLYDSRDEFGLSVHCMTYNYLINTLLGDDSIDEAYPLLKSCLEQGHLPGSKTLSIVADALCREGRLDKMKELLLFTLDENIMPSEFASKFISALCRVSKVEEGYLIHNLLNRLDKPSRKATYSNLISGFSKLNRGDMAAKLLIEMQDKGYNPSRKIFSDVICCLGQRNDAEHQFFRFLEMQLACRHSLTPFIYNVFIHAAGQAKKPEFSRQVYEMMSRNGIVPNNSSKILLLNSYLKTGNISHALDLFHTRFLTTTSRKIWHSMITGLCKAKRPEYASQLLDSMRSRKLIPTIESYEELIQLYCRLEQYEKAVYTVNDMIQVGRPVSSFIGNVFLFNALKCRKLYDTWSYISDEKNLAPSSWILGRLVGVFSDCFGKNNDDDLEKMIEQCFSMDTYTYNLLLRRSFMKGMDHTYKYISRLQEKGLHPNRWTFDIIVHGFTKLGQISEARKWMEEMQHRGFALTEGTEKLM